MKGRKAYVSCIIGMESLLPYQFLEAGTGCSNYTKSGDFGLLLTEMKDRENKTARELDRWLDKYYPKKWM